MHSVTTTGTHPPPTTGMRSAGIAIAVASIASTIAVAMDSGASGHSPLEILQSIASLQVSKGMVHVVAMASICAMGLGYGMLALRLDLRRPLSLAGVMLYWFGCVAMLGATLVDGFLIQHIAIDAVTGSVGRVAFAYNLVHYAYIALDDMAKLGWLLQSAAALAWSLLLLRSTGFERGVGGVGLLSSGLVVALVLMSSTDMSLMSLLSVLGAQLIWNLAAAGLLLRNSAGAGSTVALEGAG